MPVAMVAAVTVIPTMATVIIAFVVTFMAIIPVAIMRPVFVVMFWLVIMLFVVVVVMVRITMMITTEYRKTEADMHVHIRFGLIDR